MHAFFCRAFTGLARVLARAFALVLALVFAVAVPSIGSAMGSSAPFTPPRAAAASPDPASAVNAVDENADAISANGLSGVRVGPRAAALIDGQWVAVGDTARGARLLSVQADAATLRHADGRVERLLLNPAAPLSAKTATADRVTFTPARAQRPIAEK